jgi:hypothetical protein
MAALSTLPAVHPVLGTLHHDRERNLYEGHVTLGERDVAFRLRPDKDGHFANAEKSATRFAAAPEAEIQAISDFLAERYLDRLNGEWRQPGRKMISYATFVAAVKPGSVIFSGDGTGEFYCGGGKLFEGHCLIARTRPNGALFDAELAG